MALKSQGSIATSWQSQNKGGSVAAATSAAEKQKKTGYARNWESERNRRSSFWKYRHRYSGTWYRENHRGEEENNTTAYEERRGKSKEEKYTISKSALRTCLPIRKGKASKQAGTNARKQIDQSHQKDQKKRRRKPLAYTCAPQFVDRFHSQMFQWERTKTHHAVPHENTFKQINRQKKGKKIVRRISSIWLYHKFGLCKDGEMTTTAPSSTYLSAMIQSFANTHAENGRGGKEDKGVQNEKYRWMHFAYIIQLIKRKKKPLDSVPLKLHQRENSCNKRDHLVDLLPMQWKKEHAELMNQMFQRLENGVNNKAKISKHVTVVSSHNPSGGKNKESVCLGTSWPPRQPHYDQHWAIYTCAHIRRHSWKIHSLPATHHTPAGKQEKGVTRRRHEILRGHQRWWEIIKHS